MDKKNHLDQKNQNQDKKNEENKENDIFTTLNSGEKQENRVDIMQEDLAISLVLGDMTQIKSDAYVVPQFNGAISYGGVGGAVANNGAIQGMEKYEQLLEEERGEKRRRISRME